MSGIKCFFLTPTDLAEVSLRRYASGSSCPGPWSYHNASVPIGQRQLEEGTERTYRGCVPDPPSHDDPRWPSACPCGYAFQDGDTWQANQERLYRAEDGSLYTLRNAPPGAMWHADWAFRKGPDGHALCVMTPGGEWLVDSRASNCTMPDDNEHYCWVRHGEVPVITVDKNGHTCGAGAGSIGQKTYHGFLRNGFLVPA